MERRQIPTGGRHSLEQPSREDPLMATTHLGRAGQSRFAAKPAIGRPLLFSLLLTVAAVGMLFLLVAGPSITLPLAVGAATALMMLVGVAWVVAGPRL